MRPNPRGVRCPPSAALGFSIVEVVVALSLLACGALAIVAASAATIRSVGAAETEFLAATAARNRLETIAARGCTGIASGATTDSSAALRESWSATAPRNGLRLATARVEYIERGAPRRVVRHRLIVC